MSIQSEILASTESEAIVLGTCLKNNNLLTRVLETININDFGLEQNREIFSLMTNLYGNGEVFDHMVLYTKNEDNIAKNGGLEYLGRLLGYNTPETLKHHVENIKRLSDLRIVLETGEIIEDCYKKNANPRDIITRIESKLHSINNQNKKGIYSLEDTIQIGFEEIEKAYNSKGIMGISTGYKRLDLLTSGFRNGEYIVIGARPSMGKTAFILNLLSRIKEENKSLLVECDMSINAISTRLISTTSYVGLGKITRGTLSENEFSKIAKVSSSIAVKDNIIILDESNPRVQDIYTRAKAIKENKGLDIIVIDHIGKLKSSIKGSKYEEVTEVSNSLKKLAKDLDVCVIALCQLSRLVEQRQDKKPMLSDLRDSGGIEEDADIVGLLHREGYYRDRDDKGDKSIEDILELSIKKNRNGGIGDIYFDYHLGYQVIKER